MCRGSVVGREAEAMEELKGLCMCRESVWEWRSERRTGAGQRRPKGCVEDVGLYPKSGGKQLKYASSVGLE